jgi:hypothetical protein
MKAIRSEEKLPRNPFTESQCNTKPSRVYDQLDLQNRRTAPTPQSTTTIAGSLHTPDFESLLHPAPAVSILTGCGTTMSSMKQYVKRQHATMACISCRERKVKVFPATTFYSSLN